MCSRENRTLVRVVSVPVIILAVDDFRLLGMTRQSAFDEPSLKRCAQHPRLRLTMAVADRVIIIALERDGRMVPAHPHVERVVEKEICQEGTERSDPWAGCPQARAEQRSPFGPAPLPSLPPYYGLLRPCAPHWYSRPHGGHHLDFGLLPSHRGDRFPRSVQEPGSESRRLHAGCRLGRNQDTPQTRPGLTTSPGFDIAYTLSTRHRRFARTRLSEPYLTGSRPAFSATFTTTALDRRSLRWFGACS